MAEAPIFDLHKRYPKAIIEGIRQEILAALADLRTNQSGVDDAYFLTDLLFDLLDGSLAAVDDLTARVAALEAAVPPTEPTPEVSP